MVLQLAILFAFSPQYRFFFNFILFFGFLCVASFLRKIKFAQSIIYLSTIGAVILLFLPVNLSAVTSNKLAQNSESFSVENIIFPHANSKSVTAFETAEIGNLNYYSPVESSFLWETGNGELPCINQKQIEFFEYYFNVIPQMRSDNLGEGFYSKNTADE
jgi:hypothetical protein